MGSKNTLLTRILLMLIMVLCISTIIFVVKKYNRSILQKTDKTNGPETQLPLQTEQTITQDWKPESKIKSPKGEDYLFSLTRENEDSIESKIYLQRDQKEPKLIYSTSTRSKILVPSLWRADDSVVVNSVDVDLEHPYSELIVDMEGNIISGPSFMRLFNVWDENNRYFLTPRSTEQAAQVLVFPWAPDIAYDTLAWEDVVTKESLIVQSDPGNHYTGLGISSDGQWVLYYEHKVNLQTDSISTPQLYIQKITSSDRWALNLHSMNELRELLNREYSTIQFKLFDSFFF